MRTSVSGHVRLYYLIMIAVFQKATKMLLVSVLIMLLLLGFFGLAHVMMPVGLDGDVAMTNCPLMFGQAALCKMNLLEHIAGWKSMFTGMVQYDGVALLFSVLIALIFLHIWNKLRQPIVEHVHSVVRDVVRRNHLLPPSPLAELFSGGVLNPKLF